MRRIWFVLAFFVGLVPFQSKAILPAVVVAVADAAIVQAGTDLVFSVIAQGLAANDPYVKTTATISKARLAQNLSKSKLGFWGAAIAVGALLLPTDWFYDAETEQLMVSEYPPADSQCIISTNWVCGSKHTADKVWTESEDVGACSINGVLYKSCADVTTWFSGRWDDGGVCYSQCIGYVYRVAKGEAEIRPVTPAEIESKILPQIATATNMPDALAHADLAAIFDGAAIPYNPALANASIASLVDAYNKGLLQTSDPSAPYYVDSGTLEQVKKWADAANDAADNIVSDDELDALNEKMKQPITQAQYEESNKKYSDAVKDVTDSLPSSDKNETDIDDSFNKLDEIITDIPNATLPAPANIQLPSYSECMTLSLTDGNGHNLVFPSGKQCEKINEMKRMFGYFLALAVAFALCWQLLNRPHG